jgi:Toastrack DUF4097
MNMFDYPCPEPTLVDVRIGGGTLTVVAEQRETATVEVTPFDDSDASRHAAAETTVESGTGRLRITTPDAVGGWIFRRAGRVRVAVRVPLDCPLAIKAGSADVTCSGRYAAANVATGSGDVAVEHVTGDLTVTTGSGDVTTEQVDGRLQCNFASGAARVGHVLGDAAVHSASGDLELRRADGSVRATSASGEVRIGSVSAGQVKVNSASGAVSIGVQPGTRVWLDLVTMAGRTRTDLDVLDRAPAGTAPELSVHARTASGDIEVHRAAVAAAG